MVYVTLSFMAAQNKAKFFYIENKVLIIKENSHSIQLFAKIPIYEMKSILILSGGISIGFTYNNTAWILKAKNYEELAQWSKSFIHFQQEINNETNELKFPPFEVQCFNVRDGFVIDDSHFESPRRQKTSTNQTESVLIRERTTEILSDYD